MADMKPDGYPATPTLDKRGEVAEKSQEIGRFLDWLRDEKHVALARWVHTHDGEEVVDCPSYRERGRCYDGHTVLTERAESFDQLLHDYFGIDPEKEDQEMRAVLDYTRSLCSVCGKRLPPYSSEADHQGCGTIRLSMEG